MTDEWEDNSSDQNNSVPKALRDAYEKMKADLAAERQTIASLKDQVRQSSLGETLTSLGYSRKIAAVVPHTVEATEEKLKAWLDENSEIFPKAATSTGSTATPDQTPPQEGTPQVQDRMGAAIAAGLPAETVRSLENQIAQAATPEDLDKVMEQHRNVKLKF